MVLDAIVKEDGTLIAKAPKPLWGKKVKIIVKNRTVSAHPRKELSQWENMTRALDEIDALELPQREFNDILTELRTFRETV